MQRSCFWGHLPWVLALLATFEIWTAFAAKTTPFRYEDLPDLSGKTFIITGATSGLGKSQAYHLAQHKAHVIVVGRSEAKLKDVVQWIKTETNNQNVEGMMADLMDLKSVVSFCDEFLSKDIPLYSLTLNAASVYDTFTVSKDGIEGQWQTSVLAQYCLCMRLLPALQKSSEARIVIVSSNAHSGPKSQFRLDNDYINDKDSYSRFKRYGETKCANVLLARYLSNYLSENGYENIYVNSLHPGVVATDIWRTFWAPVRVLFSWILTSPDSAAKTQTYLSASPEVATKKYRGEYFVPDAKLSAASAVATDDAYGQRLVEFLESQMQSAIAS